MSDRPTPETDALIRGNDAAFNFCAIQMLDHARRLERERDLWKAEAERWRDSSNILNKISDMRGQMNATYGAGRGWEAALDEMEEFLKR